jgi:hypothetical protein
VGGAVPITNPQTGLDFSKGQQGQQGIVFGLVARVTFSVSVVGNAGSPYTNAARLTQFQITD